MIFHPGILALVGGSAFIAFLMIYAVAVGAVIVLNWDFSSSSASQLGLERKTYLVSTLMNYVLGLQVLSSLLFIYTVDDIHPMFVGAMCATGAFNANPVGWYGLAVKVAACFLAGLWLILNYLDQKAEDYPLVRLKYRLLIFLLPFILADGLLQLWYFLGLDPDIITSCCGSLFSESGTGVASSLAGLALKPTMKVFYGGYGILFGAAFICLRWGKPLFRYIYSLTAGVLFFVALAAIISFISIYIYELPTHHCPFDILQSGYSFIGYPLYISLFAGTFYGLLPGIFQPLKKIGSLKDIMLHSERTWIFLSMGCLIIFVLTASWKVAASNLTYISY